MPPITPKKRLWLPIPIINPEPRRTKGSQILSNVLSVLAQLGFDLCSACCLDDSLGLGSREEVLMCKDLHDVLRLGDVELFGTQAFPHSLVEKAEELDVSIRAAFLHVNQDSLRQHRVDWKEGWHLKILSMEFLCTLAVELAVLATSWQLPRRLVARKLHDSWEEDWDDADYGLFLG